MYPYGRKGGDVNAEESTVESPLYSDAANGTWGDHSDDLGTVGVGSGNVVQNRQQSRMELEGRNAGGAGEGIAV